MKSQHRLKANSTVFINILFFFSRFNKASLLVSVLEGSNFYTLTYMLQRLYKYRN